MSTTYAEEILGNHVRKITIEGKLDAPNTMVIEKELSKLVLSQKSDQVIIDLSGVDYMSSYGLRLMLICAKELHKNKGGLHLAAANQRIMEIIFLAGYDTLFPVHETVEDALLLLSGGA